LSIISLISYTTKSYYRKYTQF